MAAHRRVSRNNAKKKEAAAHGVSAKIIISVTLRARVTR